MAVSYIPRQSLVPFRVRLARSCSGARLLPGPTSPTGTRRPGALSLDRPLPVAQSRARDGTPVPSGGTAVERRNQPHHTLERGVVSRRCPAPLVAAQGIWRCGCRVPSLWLEHRVIGHKDEDSARSDCHGSPKGLYCALSYLPTARRGPHSALAFRRCRLCVPKAPCNPARKAQKNFATGMAISLSASVTATMPPPPTAAEDGRIDRRGGAVACRTRRAQRGRKGGSPRRCA